MTVRGIGQRSVTGTLREGIISALALGVVVLFVASEAGTRGAVWRGAICQTHARQVGMALLLYASDYDEHLPARAANIGELMGATRQYQTGLSCYRCPEPPGPGEHSMPVFRIPALYAGRAISCGWSDPYLEGRASEPSRTVMAYETLIDAGTPIRPTYRHDRGAVMLSFAGRALWVPRIVPARQSARELSPPIHP